VRPVYIAGGSSELEACQRMIDAVIASGGRITCDWTRDPGWALGRPLTMVERSDTGARDLAAVMSAQIFWLMLPERPSEGAAAELGGALVMRALAAVMKFPEPRLVVASGPMTDSRMFPAMADHVFPDHERALVFVLDAMRAPARKL
jgi:hypothetical protein